MKIYIMRKSIALAFLFVLFVVEVLAQGPSRIRSLGGGVSNRIMRIFQDGGNIVRAITGKPTVEGQPYVSDVWLKGKVTFANGLVRYTDRLNYDALDHMLIMFEDGIELEFTAPVKSFQLYEEDNMREFWMVKGTFYEVLHQDQIILLKHHKKDIVLESKYGSAWATGKIMSQNQLYFLDPHFNLVKVHKGSEFLRAFPETQDKLKGFIKNEKLNLRSEEDLLRLVQYQASLSK